MFPLKNNFLFSVIFLFWLFVITPVSAQYNKYKTGGNKNMLEYINKYRISMGLPEVKYDAGLAEAAKLQALDNYVKKKFRKGGDDVNKLHQNAMFPLVRDRVSAVGVNTKGEACAEICYAKAGMNNKPLTMAIRPYQSLEQLMFTRYKRSPGHHAILVNPDFVKAGIHTIYDGKYVYNAIVFMTDKKRRSNRRS